MKLKYRGKIYKFKNVEVEDNNYFNSINNINYHLSCEYNFANLYMWGKIYNTQWCDFYDMPLIFLGKDNMLLFPLSEINNIEKLNELLTAFKEAGGSGTITQVPESFIEKISDTRKKSFSITQNYDFADYIHKRERLVSLTGRKLNKNLISTDF